MNDTTAKKYLYQHVSQETAYLVEDYPWGFRLRTSIRYWIESKKSHGQRFGSQTINPKNGKWCAPKYSTYYPIIVMYLDENNHIKWNCLRMNDNGQEINTFKEIHLEFLNEFQKRELKEIIAFEKVMRDVKFTVVECPVGPITLFSKDPEEIKKKEQMIEWQEKNRMKKEEDLKQINRAIGYEMSKISL